MIVKLSDLILPHFRKFYHAYQNNEYTFYIHKGGRNSAKSTHISMIAVVLDMIENPVTSVVCKRYGNSLPLTVIPQVKWAIKALGVEHLFSELKARGQESLTYIPRGNKIIFLGADDPEKIKGLKNDKFPVARLWIDEITQFESEETLDSIKNSIIRDILPEGLTYKICYSYNPPKRKHHWCNKKYESVTLGKDYYVLHSSYLNNPHVSKAFIDEAEYIREINPRKYDHEYMGLPIGSGIVPFDKLKFRQITDEEIKQFDNIKQGLDWGYSVDPVHFSRSHYDKTRKILYIFGEIHEVKMGNEKLAETIKSKGWNDSEVIADSAEPKSIEELRKYSIKCKGADKGQGSVEYGEKWLDEREEIIIDPVRCPNTAREWENIDYAVDKDGNPKDRLIDKDNHSIDSIRYGLQDEMDNKRKGMRGKAFGG